MSLTGKEHTHTLTVAITLNHRTGHEVKMKHINTWHFIHPSFHADLLPSQTLCLHNFCLISHCESYYLACTNSLWGLFFYVRTWMNSESWGNYLQYFHTQKITTVHWYRKIFSTGSNILSLSWQKKNISVHANQKSNIPIPACSRNGWRSLQLVSWNKVHVA